MEGAKHGTDAWRLQWAKIQCVEAEWQWVVFGGEGVTFLNVVGVVNGSKSGEPLFYE